MKLSLRWLFDHIDADWQSIPLAELVQTFIKTTAEIEQVHSVNIPVKNWFVGSVTEKISETTHLFIAEKNSTITLPTRADVQPGLFYLIKKEEDSYLWVSMRDVGSSKEGFLPPFSIESSALSGKWRDEFQAHDAIITVDNKSINHRPDLWGHRGIARELAAKYGWKMVEERHFLAQHEIQTTNDTKAAVGSVAIENKLGSGCSRFAAITVERVVNRLSDMMTVVRLARADIRAIDAIVDATNYTMLDWGHPLHAFDALALGTSLVIRKAVGQETLRVLDDSVVNLTEHDIVIADSQKPVSLAGIMGGSSVAVQAHTTSLLVEAAAFDATTIRKTAARVGKRTESSARFEKGLNPAILEAVLLRFLKVISDAGITHTVSSPVVALGPLPALTTIIVEHSQIEAALGTSISGVVIEALLQALQFQVQEKGGIYTIAVPLSRSKDIKIPQDIIEEVGRLYGYDHIEPAYALRAMKPYDITSVMRMRDIKHFFSYSMHMHEVMTYAFFDESWLKKIAWEPQKPLQVKAAVSENWRRLVTTLTPALLNMVHQNAAQSNDLRFYEYAHVWPHQETGTVEREVLSGIRAHTQKAVDFYQAKEELVAFFDTLSLSVSWQKVSHVPYPWYMPYQTAFLFHEQQCIGIAGKVNPLFYQNIALGDAFIWELDAHYLMAYKASTHRYKAPSKYPRVTRDISMLIPSAIPVEQLQKSIAGIDSRIIALDLVDFFEKKEWENQRSVTLRLTIEDKDKTLESADVETLLVKVQQALQTHGAHIR